LQRYIDKFGPEAGPKIHHAVRSRAAYKGVSTRRRHRIEVLTGRPYRLRRKSLAAKDQGLLPLSAPAENDRASAVVSGVGVASLAGVAGDATSGDGMGNAEQDT
jgi:hypothetical protein